jgi:hypothetical protein
VPGSLFRLVLSQYDASTLWARNSRRDSMSKGMDRKKETRKKPAKTFDEKRAAKREKRDARR